MDTQLAKSLTELIDETLAELDELKKSRFEAEEIDMGSDANGEMKKEEEKSEDEKEESEDEEKAEKADDESEEEGEEESEDEDMDKAEKELSKAEDEVKKAMAKRDMCKAEASRMKAKSIKMNKADEEKEEEKDEEKEEKKMEKSVKTSEIEALKKSFENQLADITAALNKIANAPVPARGNTYRDVQPLAKGATEVEPLNKAKVLSDLVSLKKSGKEVSSDDVLRAEIGGQGDLHEIANKYGIK